MIKDLLDLASDLAMAGAGEVERPVHLRRATSTAYYALFHAIATLCAKQLVGSAKSWDLVTPIYRSLDHRKARETLTALRKERTGSPVAIIAVAFATLQDARHEADYDPRPFRRDRGGTFDLIDAAREAIAVLETMPPDEQLGLAVKLIARSR